MIKSLFANFLQAGKWVWMIRDQILGDVRSCGKRLGWGRGEQVRPLPPLNIHIWRSRQSWKWLSPSTCPEQRCGDGVSSSKTSQDVGFNHVAWWPVTFKEEEFVSRASPDGPLPWALGHNASNTLVHPLYRHPWETCGPFRSFGHQIKMSI